MTDVTAIHQEQVRGLSDTIKILSLLHQEVQEREKIHCLNRGYLLRVKKFAISVTWMSSDIWSEASERYQCNLKLANAEQRAGIGASPGPFQPKLL